LETTRKLNRAALLLVLIFLGRTCVESETTRDEKALADTPEGETASATSRQDGAFPVVSDPKPLRPLMERELRGCFDFFWNEWISDPNSPTYGMTSGDYVGLNKYSPIPIESQGFENYSTQLLWRLLHNNEHMQRGLKKREFRHVASSQRHR